MISPADALVLNAIQYDLEPSEEPFLKASKKLGVDEAKLIKRVRRLLAAGVVRRLGFSVNYRAYGYVSALVAAALRGRSREELAEAIRLLSSSGGIKHAYLREHPRFNLWFTVRARSLEELYDRASRLARSVLASEHLVLPSEEVCKLSVKYDLERGVSLSASNYLRKDAPRIWDLGLEKDLVEQLARIPVSTRPFRELARKSGETEKALVDLSRELLRKGVFYDFGAVVNPESVGFRYNAMVAAEGGTQTCKMISEKVPEATHVVLRGAPKDKWDKPVFFVVHGRTRKLVDQVIDYAQQITGFCCREVMYGVWGVTR